MHKVLANSPYITQFTDFPGALPISNSVPTKWPSAELKKYVEGVIAVVSASSSAVLEDTHVHTADPRWGGIKRSEANCVLWKVLKVVCDTLLNNREAYKRAPAAVLSEAVRAVLTQHVQQGTARPISAPAPAPAALPQEDPAALADVQNLLLMGRLDAACETAIKVRVDDVGVTNLDTED